MKKITLSVWLTHFALCLGLIIHHVATRRFKPHRPISVKTISVQPMGAAMTIATVEKKTTVKPKPKPSPKVLPKSKPTLSVKPVAKSEAISPSPSPPQPQRPRTELSVPSIVSTPKTQIEVPNAADPMYEEMLIAYLKNALELPEYGDVKTKITIDRMGTLTKLEILDAKSEKNRSYLQTHLGELLFPPTDIEQTFTITFRNN